MDQDANPFLTIMAAVLFFKRNTVTTTAGSFDLGGLGVVKLEVHSASGKRREVEEEQVTLATPPATSRLNFADIMAEESCRWTRKKMNKRERWHSG